MCTQWLPEAGSQGAQFRAAGCLPCKTGRVLAALIIFLFLKGCLLRRSFVRILRNNGEVFMITWISLYCSLALLVLACILFRAKRDKILEKKRPGKKKSKWKLTCEVLAALGTGFIILFLVGFYIESTYQESLKFDEEIEEEIEFNIDAARKISFKTYDGKEIEVKNITSLNLEIMTHDGRKVCLNKVTRKGGWTLWSSPVEYVEYYWKLCEEVK
jgi:hypothetical protein